MVTAVSKKVVGAAAGGSQSHDLQDIEADIARLFGEVMGRPDVRIDDDFFDLGGDSLEAEKLMAWLERRCGVSLPVSTILEATTPRTLARLVVDASTKARDSCIVCVQAKGLGTPLFVVHGIYGDVNYAKKIAGVLGPTRPIYGLRAIGLRAGESPISGIPRLAERYVSELRAIKPSGPYLVHGYCGGGFIAYEMAQQLWQAGETVTGLMIIDPPIDWRRTPFLVASGRFRLAILKLAASSRLEWANLRSFFYTARPDKFRRVSVARSLWHSLAHYDPKPYSGESLLIYSAETRGILLHPKRGLQTLMDHARFIEGGNTHRAVFKQGGPATLAETKAFIERLDPV